jgi:hypothetical protein
MRKRNFARSPRKISTIGTQASIEKTSISITVKDGKRWTNLDAYFTGKYLWFATILSSFNRLKVRVSARLSNTICENSTELVMARLVIFEHALKKRQ